jgi:predicted phage terminase large subunit-like protein
MEDYVLIDDVVVGQWSSGERDKVMRQTAEMDGYETTIYVEQEPGSSGLTLVRHIIRALMGFPCYSSSPSGSKVARATPVAAYAEGLGFKMRKAEWNGVLLDQLQVFPQGKHDDMVDALSGAFAQLSGGVPNVIHGYILASGEDPIRERVPLSPEEIENLPDGLRELVSESRAMALDRQTQDDDW